MNYIKKAMICAAAAGAATLANATPVVSNVTMAQGLANRQVTITYSVSEDAVVTLDVQTNATPNAATGWVSIGGVAICNAKGDVWKKVEAGSRTITWRPDLSWTDENGNGFNIANGCAKAIVTAYALDNTPDYMVVDLSAAAQPNTQKYYPAADFLPGGLLGNSDYRTTSLVMRKINAKDIEWTMGSTSDEQLYRTAASEATHKVILDNNYYIGVFPITQSQWVEVATNSGARASFPTEGMMHPMETVCYNEIRKTYSTSSGVNSSGIWPAYSTDGVYPAEPKSSSFLGLLRIKTGIDFDLPSEAQWEFACRAGHGSGYWGDGSLIQTDSSENLGRIAHYTLNSGNTTAIVGSYAPNSWGLYDMHGNVWELCLDRYADNISSLNGAVCLFGDSDRNPVRRGGGFGSGVDGCRPANRNGSGSVQYRQNNTGFRVVCTAGLQ